MKRFTTLIAAMFAGVAMSTAAVAQDSTLKKIRDTGTIKIGHRDASVPFSYLDDSQKPVGYGVDICLKIADAVKAKTGEKSSMEESMLDFAESVQENSRLSCQIKVSDELDGLVVTMPESQH